MRPEDFDFELPGEQIAQAPAERRDRSRLMVLDRAEDSVTHRSFADLGELLVEGDLLVVNDAQVIPARLLGRKRETGGKAELLLVRPAGAQTAAAALGGRADEVEWVCLGQASKGLRAGAELEFEGGLQATVVEGLGGGEYRVRLFAAGARSLAALLDQAGRIPLPPYIERPAGDLDRERYQTIYARSPGSVAAPTAGLHFTEAIFARLEAKGVRRASVTLDVGPGTFLPVRDGSLDQHRMHRERFEIPLATSEAIAQTRRRRGRVVAVGTTVVRTLEGASGYVLAPTPGVGETDLFIRPGFRFRYVDALITNFHLPRSTLLMLVCAFAGTERTLVAYREAVARGYRFFSYGDAMLIS
jgi:S-adenosylmethionine:tRNA ribosyltransferase-isomerase